MSIPDFDFERFDIPISLTYDNSTLDWLNKRSTPNYGVKTREQYGFRDISGKDMNTYLNSLTPEGLYNHPSNTPNNTDYATEAINDDRLPFVLHANTEAKGLQPFGVQHYGYEPDKQLKNQGLYEHELGHFNDVRMNKYVGEPYQYAGKERYKKYVDGLIKSGMPEGIARREAPALIAEEKYRNYMRDKYGRVR